MDPPDRSPNFMGATIIDVDIDAANNMNSDLPTWLRDVLDRALSASGIRTKKKTASDEAIDSLTELDLLKISDPTCPICFDPYEAGKEKDYKKNEQEVNPKVDETVSASPAHKRVMENNSAICENMKSMYNIHNVQSLQHGSQFNDPSLFLPVDEGAIIHSRFPTKNLCTLEPARPDQILMGYVDEEKENKEKRELDKDEQDVPHVPVKMPNCDHIFGRSCIIEWLKGNVSCPLCRKEVEALKETDPKVARQEAIRNNSSYNFNNDRDLVVDHISNHLTDVFNPFRRPFNPAITPLTDSYMHQDWATPYYTAEGDLPRSISNREPHLVLPRRFPFSEGPTAIPFMPRRHRVRDLRRESRRNNPDTNATSNNNETSYTDSQYEPPTSNDLASSDSRLGSVDQYEDQSPNDASTSTLQGSLSASSGRGGPERTTRSRSSNGRSHPYYRPPSVE